eukprot:15469930-Alexandrium_andersonii.AAC.1
MKEEQSEPAPMEEEEGDSPETKESLKAAIESLTGIAGMEATVEELNRRLMLLERRSEQLSPKKLQEAFQLACRHADRCKRALADQEKQLEDLESK